MVQPNRVLLRCVVHYRSCAAVLQGFREVQSQIFRRVSLVSLSLSFPHRSDLAFLPHLPSSL